MKKYTITAYKIVFVVSAFFSLAACADYDLESEVDAKPIRLVAGREYDPTRAVVATADLQGPVFDADQTVNVWITGESSDNPTTAAIGETPNKFTTGTAVGGKNPLTLPDNNTLYYYTGSNSKIHVHAAYPANSKVDVKDSTEFTVQYDQTTPENYNNSDLMFVPPFDHNKTAEVVSMPFKHKMVKLIVNAIPDGDVTIDRELTLGWIKRRVAIDVANGDFTYSTTTPNSVRVSDENENDLKTCTIKILNGGAAVFPPQTLEAASQFIMITGKDKDGASQTAQFNIIDKTFEEGRVYKLNLHISNLDFTPNSEGPHVSTITGWSEDYDELTVTPSGGYSGVSIATIDGNVTDADGLNKDGIYVYTGEPRCPTPAVTYGDNGIPMNPGTDFRYVYVDNLNASSNAQVMVLGMGSYAGLAALRPFTIERATAKISFDEGSDKTGENAVDYNPDENIGVVVARNTGDGDVKYEVIADGEGESTDCASVDPVDGFVIVQNVGRCTIKATATSGRNYDYPSPDNTCTYKIEIKPKEVKDENLTVTYAPTEFTFDDTDKKLTKLVVADGEHTLVEDVDYTYTFTNVRHHGKAKLTIKGKGNYSEDTKIEIEIPIKQAKPTITVKETELALGIQTSTAPKSRKKTREATTQDWAQSKIRFSLSPTADVKSNEYLTVNNNGLLTGLKEGTTTVYVSIAADDSEYEDWLAADQKSFKVTVYPSDFTFRITRVAVPGYRLKQVVIDPDGIPVGAHTKWKVPASGEWQIDCYGAQGGTTPRWKTERTDFRRTTNTDVGLEVQDVEYKNQGTGGRGAHIAGRINITKNMILHVNLGQEGRVVYPGEQRLRGEKADICPYNSSSDEWTVLYDANITKRGKNGGKKNGDLSYLKAGDYEWAAYAWNGGGGFIWGGRCVWLYPTFYNQDNYFVGNTADSGRGQSYVHFPITGGGGATDVSLAWDEVKYNPPTTTSWPTSHAMVNREYGVITSGEYKDDNHVVGIQWKNPAHLFSRIIVAGGGGGGLFYDTANSFGDGGSGGAWEGTIGLYLDAGEGGHMNAGGRGGIWRNWNMKDQNGKSVYGRADVRTNSYSGAEHYKNRDDHGTMWHSDITYLDGPYAGGYSGSDGMFGEGGYTTQPAQGCGGGGGGWYGGGAGAEESSNGTAGGGSSFIWTDKVDVQRYDYSTRSTSTSAGTLTSYITYESTSVPMYKLYDTIDADWVKYNKCVTGGTNAADPTTPPAHIKAANYYNYMPTNSTAKLGRGNDLGIQCPFFHEIVTKDAGVNAGDGWAKITLVEIDDEQPTD